MKKNYKSPKVGVIKVAAEQDVFAVSSNLESLDYGGSAWADPTTTPSSGTSLGGLSSGGSAWTTPDTSAHADKSFSLGTLENGGSAF